MNLVFEELENVNILCILNDSYAGYVLKCYSIH